MADAGRKLAAAVPALLDAVEATLRPPTAEQERRIGAGFAAALAMSERKLAAVSDALVPMAGESVTDAAHRLVNDVKEAKRKAVDLEDERDALLAQNVGEGHGQPCYYCGEPCNAAAGDPSRWPVLLCHADDPGKVKPHHVGCVSKRLRAVAAALAILGEVPPDAVVAGGVVSRAIAALTL